jgi:hypothetical protein
MSNKNTTLDESKEKDNVDNMMHVGLELLHRSLMLLHKAGQENPVLVQLYSGFFETVVLQTAPIYAYNVAYLEPLSRIELTKNVLSSTVKSQILNAWKALLSNQLKADEKLLASTQFYEYNCTDTKFSADKVSETWNEMKSNFMSGIYLPVVFYYKSHIITNNKLHFGMLVLNYSSKFECNHCLHPFAEIHCFGCGQVGYCSLHCQRLDLDNHQVVCANRQPGFEDPKINIKLNYFRFYFLYYAFQFKYTLIYSIYYDDKSKSLKVKILPKKKSIAFTVKQKLFTNKDTRKFFYILSKNPSIVYFRQLRWLIAEDTVHCLFVGSRKNLVALKIKESDKNHPPVYVLQKSIPDDNDDDEQKSSIKEINSSSSSSSFSSSSSSFSSSFSSSSSSFSSSSSYLCTDEID